MRFKQGLSRRLGIARQRPLIFGRYDFRGGLSVKVFGGRISRRVRFRSGDTSEKSLVLTSDSVADLNRKEKALASAARLAGLLLASGGVLCLFILFYFLYHYSWTGERRFDSSLGIILYYILPALIASLLFASLKLPPNHRVGLVLFLCSAGISVYALEFWLELAPAEVMTLRERARAAKPFGANFDVRSKREVLADLRAMGVEAYPAFMRFDLMQLHRGLSRRLMLAERGTEGLLPLAGISKKVSILCNESGQYTIYKSDEHGFHNPQGLWTGGRIDIAAVGDSFTHGWCVPSDRNFVALVRERYPFTLNLGMSGYGPLSELAVIKEYLPSVRPKALLWFYFEGNDLADLELEKQSSLLIRYLTSFTQGLSGRQAELDNHMLRYFNEKIDKGKFLVTLDEISEKFKDPQKLASTVEGIVKLGQVRQMLGLAYGHYTREPQDLHLLTDELAESESSFRQVLLQAKASVEAWGGKMYFVYLPDYRYNWEKVKQDKEKVLSLVRSLGFAVVDIERVFRAHSDPLSLYPHRLPGHYNEKGHQTVAETVLQFISLQN